VKYPTPRRISSNFVTGGAGAAAVCPPLWAVIDRRPNPTAAADKIDVVTNWRRFMLTTRLLLLGERREAHAER
jgi:hypothetical protein